MLFSLQASTKLTIIFQGQTIVRGKLLRKKGERGGKGESKCECGKKRKENAIKLLEELLMFIHM